MIGSQIAADADAAVTVGERRPSLASAVGDRPSVNEADAGCIGVRAAERLDLQALEGPRIFRGRLRIHAGRPWLFAFVQSPLGNIIVLQPIDARSVPIARAG